MIYWLLLIILITLQILRRWSNLTFLWSGFYLYCLGALFSILNISIVSVPLMRVSLVLWLFGLFFMVLKPGKNPRPEI